MNIFFSHECELVVAGTLGICLERITFVHLAPSSPEVMGLSDIMSTSVQLRWVANKRCYHCS